MRKLALLASTCLLISVAKADHSKGNDWSTKVLDDVQKVTKFCRASNTKAIEAFEKKNNLNFSSFVASDLRQDPSRLPTTEPAMQVYCNSAIGTEFGTVEFTSTPSGAKIYVDGDLQFSPTNYRFNYPVGEYDFRIEMSKDSICLGHLVIEANKTYSTTCP